MRDRLVWRHQPLDQHLDATAGLLGPQQPRRQHPRIVEHQQVARPEQACQIAKPQVGRIAALRQVQQPAVAATRTRLLRNQALGQVVMKIAQLHGRAMLAQGVAAAADVAILRDSLPGWWNW